MSLINQMLRDLQQQKKSGAPAKQEPSRRRGLERIPYLPLPLIFGGAALALLFLVWWMAGALSDWMFGFEPSEKTVTPQQVVTSGPTTQETAVAAEPDRLTPAEREAEPPVATVVVAAEPEQAIEPAGRSTAQAPAVATAPVEKLSKVAPESTLQPAARRTALAPKRLVKKVTPVQAAPSKTAAPASSRLHPDDLPGAVLSKNPAPTESLSLSRPSRIAATTPYGMAEEAFLDGRWALEQKRSKLAVRSLQDALELYPGHLPARALLVEILDKEGKTGEAMFLLAEGLEIAPDYITFKKAYARMLADQGDYDAATRVMLNGGLPTVEDDPEAHVVLATLYQRLGEFFLAAQTYRNLLVAWPQTGAFWVGLGTALDGQKLAAEAMECYRRALATKNLRQDLSRYAEKRLSQGS